MTPAQRAKAVLAGQAYAVSLYNDMLDPTNRGSKFRWHKLPGMAASLASSGVFMGFHFRTPKTVMDEISVLAGRTARAHAKLLITANRKPGDQWGPATKMVPCP